MRALCLDSATARAVFAAVALACATPAGAQNVVAVRVWESPDSTRAVFDLSGPVDYKVFALDGPNRLVVDLRDGALGGDFAPPQAKGLIRGLRTGKPTPRDLRIVIDLAEGVRPKSFLLPPAQRFGHRLVIDLFPRKGTPDVVKSAPPEVRSDAQRDVVVAIDAGHGGDDPGALGGLGTREKDVTLAIAKALKQQIDAEPGMSAILVREGDYYIALKKRYENARSKNADLFVSVHADAFTKRTAAGSSVYMLSQRGATSEAARFLAKKENQSDLVGGVSLNDKDGTLAAVLLDLSQGATLASSDIVATQVLTSLKRLGRVHSNQVQRANFMVLRAPDVPSILVETGFISNPGEEKLLRDPAHRKKIAAAILGGVRSYFHTMPPPGTWIAANRLAPTEHVVASGESLSLIAERHGTTVARLRDVNKLRNDTVQVGVVLRIPTSS